MRGVNCPLVRILFANSSYINYRAASLNGFKWSLYYASSQGIKALQETSSGWMDVSSCIFFFFFFIAVAAVLVASRQAIKQASRGFTLHLQAASALIYLQITVHSSAFYCVLASDAFKTI